MTVGLYTSIDDTERKFDGRRALIHLTDQTPFKPPELCVSFRSKWGRSFYYILIRFAGYSNNHGMLRNSKKMPMAFCII